MDICEANSHSLRWASPDLTWNTLPPWRFLWQRSPFSKVRLLNKDRLFLDPSLLAPSNEPVRTAEELDALWEELLDAVKGNDLTYFTDCL